MRLLFVFPNFDVGGIELRAVTLIKALPDHWDVAIASIGGGTGAAASLGDHSRAHMVDIPKNNRWLLSSICHSCRAISASTEDGTAS